MLKRKLLIGFTGPFIIRPLLLLAGSFFTTPQILSFLLAFGLGLDNLFAAPIPWLIQTIEEVLSNIMK